MSNLDFIPRSDYSFDSWQINFVKKVNELKSSWNLSAAALTEWTLLTETPGTKKKEWDSVWAIVSSRLFDKADTQRKKDACRSYESGNKNNPQDTSLRFYINRYIRYNPLVTNDQKVEMGLRVPDTIKTPSPGFTASGLDPSVLGAVKAMHHLIQTSQVITPGANHRGLDKGVEAIEIYLYVAETTAKVAPPIRDFDLVGEVKNGWYTHRFDPEQEGMRAWYIARKRFKGRKRTFGPFSEPWSGLIW